MRHTAGTVNVLAGTGAVVRANREHQNTAEERRRLELISWEDFLKVELRVGRVLDAAPFPEARKPAIILKVDFGPELGVKTSSAQLTALYQPADLIGRLVVGVVNLPPKRIGPLLSEFLVTGFHDEDGGVALCVPDRRVPPGTKLL